MASYDLLDRPVWSAFSGRQSAFAVDNGRALGLLPEVGPFVAAADRSPESLAALATMVPSKGWAVTNEAEEMPAPPGTVVRERAVLNQMVAERMSPGGGDTPFTVLTAADAADMLALATLTKPGPFAVRTHELGYFVGVKQGGRLVAMAGERMKPEGFTEISAVCTLPEFRGRGYAGALMRVVAERILARGEMPFLHVYPHNTGAIALYESLGFRLRRAMSMTVLARGN